MTDRNIPENYPVDYLSNRYWGRNDRPVSMKDLESIRSILLKMGMVTSVGLSEGMRYLELSGNITDDEWTILCAFMFNPTAEEIAALPEV